MTILMLPCRAISRSYPLFNNTQNYNRLIRTSNKICLVQKRDDSTNPNEGFIGGLANKANLLGEAPFTQFIEDVLVNVHDAFSLGWPSVIFGAAVCFRLFVCFPIKIYQENMIAKLVNVQPKIKQTFEAKTSWLNKKSIFITPEFSKRMSKEVRAWFDATIHSSQLTQSFEAKRNSE